MPPKEEVPVVADEQDDSYASTNADKEPSGPRGKTSNPNRNVGGTAQDGGLSTADTVADGGPDGEEKDGSYKPS